MSSATRNPFSMTCCLRALLEDVSFTNRSLKMASTRPRVLSSYQQIRSFTVTPRQMQDKADDVDVDGDMGSQTITDKYNKIVKRDGPDDVFELPPRSRVVPVSPSYFTGNSAFFDSWFALKDLLYKYQTLPTILPSEVARTAWKSLQDFRSMAGGVVQASKYKKVRAVLQRLNRIQPDLMPEEVKAVLDTYKRPDFAAMQRRRPKIIDRFGRARAAGRRKTSNAEAYLVEGSGGCFVNGKPLFEMFPRLVDRESILWPLKVTNRVDRYNVWASSRGGGISGQAGAITLAVTKALLTHEPLLKPVLRRGKPPEKPQILFGFSFPIRSFRPPLPVFTLPTVCTS
ncbi:37S ribosomal protein S9, mitochondrial, variant 2 [Orbilia oligospora]|uniref:37S ribosomal protein S9, mitochondrial, variant 2 n=1 Tax=Orbilia oligospora TaxID=2813651 RepID=A0A7C8U2Z3_ORBOL|nr:37S ribosomal protein S9, mitochondrial, variant 2 [Orbilia oligospora]